MQTYRRRIQSFAKYSYAITLPVHWVKKNNLIPAPKKREKNNNRNQLAKHKNINGTLQKRKGTKNQNLEDSSGECSIVNLFEMPDGSLQIFPARDITPKPEHIYRLDLDELISQHPNFIEDKAIRMLLISYYVNGATGVELFSKKPIPREIIGQVKQIQERLLLNWNTNRLSSHRILIKNVFKEDQENIFQDEIPQYLRESFSVLLWIIDDILSALENGDYSLLKSISDQDDEIDRYYFFTVRQIRSIFETGQISHPLNYSHKKLIDLRLLAKVIEDTGDCLKNIAELLLKNNEFFKKIGLLGYVEESFKELKEIYGDLSDYLKINLDQKRPEAGMNQEIMAKIQDYRVRGKKLQEKWETLAPKFEFKKEYNYMYYYNAGQLVINIDNLFKKIFDFTNLFF